MDYNTIFEELFNSNKHRNVDSLLSYLNSLHREATNLSVSLSNDIVDTKFLNDIREVLEQKNLSVYFGKTLRQVKCIVPDDYGREHSVIIQYKDKNKLVIKSTSLPHSTFQDQEFTSIADILDSFNNYIFNLKNYFYELDRIDRVCCVVDPLHPSYKDDYRRILLENRVWLHIEVHLDGGVTCLRVVGAGVMWQNKLQSGLSCWEHDKDIVENLMCIFDIDEFPRTATEDELLQTAGTTGNERECSICLCAQIPDTKCGLPEPLCSNSKCGSYYHTICLYQWLVASAGGRVPNFGVASGECPNCLQSISCANNSF